MVLKINTIYSCQKCGAQSSKWNGRCLECGSWGTLKEEIVDKKDGDKKMIGKISSAEIINLSTLAAGDQKRIKTNIEEVDRVLGGGFVPGSLILLSGEPGIGKSTILAQIADKISGKENKTIYASGEESALQIKSRFERLRCDLQKIAFVQETNVEKIINVLKKEKPDLAIIDSIQTVYSSLVEGEAGSVSQIRASTISFLELAKQEDIIIILVGHITKDGQVAGPKTLEHIVDAVINLESQKNGDFRILRATKNRFGAVSEIGIFEMTGTGMKEVKDPSAVFIDPDRQETTGSVLSAVMEGSRPFFLEIQALVTRTVFGYPQRKTSGFDLNRLQVLAAVLTKRTKINLINQDVILNVAGGLKISDPSLDLAVCLAIASSLYSQVIKKDIIAIGEVGLGGEIRPVAKLKERLYEAEKIGYKKAIIPAVKEISSGIDVIKVKNLEEAVKEMMKI
jgi:DNA repair protein RadA/Sms